MSVEDQSGPSSLAASASRQVQAILEAAESSAEAIRREALDEADSIRSQARADAGRASESIEDAVRRLEALHSELGALIASLRTGDERTAPASPEPAPVSTEPAPADPAPPKDDEDVAGARLIALNMALDGTPREQTAQYLAENFSVSDPEGLLDDVYASAGA
jgi:hypothetical protein